MTTLTELNKKVWYRFLKVVYILCYIPYIFLLILGVTDFGRDYHKQVLPNSVDTLILDPDFFKLSVYDMEDVFSEVVRESNVTIGVWNGNKTVQYTGMSYNEKINFLNRVKKDNNPTTLLKEKYIYKSYYTWNFKNIIIYSILFTILYFLMMESIRRVFYYVLLGKVFPR